MLRGALLSLLSHGALVWQIGTLVLALIGARLVTRRAQAAASKRASDRRGVLGLASASLVDLPDGELVTIRGVIAIEGGLGDGSIAAADLIRVTKIRGNPDVVESIGRAHADRLLLIVGDDQIAVDDDVAIVLGSRERAKRRRMGRDAALFRGAIDRSARHPGYAVTLRSLRGGDEVIASGVLDRVDGAGSYRDNPVARRLTRAHAQGGVKMAFARAPHDGLLASILPPLVGAIAAAAIALAFFFTLGAFAIGRLVSAKSSAGPSAEQVLAAASLAAVSPWTRGEVGEKIEEIAEQREDGELIEMLTALQRGRGERRKVVELLLDRGQVERAAEEAEAAGLDDLASLAWYAAARFERASAAWVRAGERAPRAEADRWFLRRRDKHRFGALVHMLASRLDLAAAEARLLTDAIWGPHPSKDGFRYDETSERARCLADALDARAGDRGARDRLARAVRDENKLFCTLLRADLLDGKDRGALARSFAKEKASGSDEVKALRWLAELAAEGDRASVEMPAGVIDDPSQAFLHPFRAIQDALPAVDRALADAPAAGAIALRSRVRAAASAALFASAAGDHEEAKRLVAASAEALRALAPGDRPADLDLGRLAQIEMHLALAANTVSWIDVARFGLAAPVSPLIEARASGDDRAVAVAAKLFNGDVPSLLSIDRDGARLASILRDTSLRSHFGTWSYTELCRAVRLLTPALNRGQDDLLRFLRWGRRSIPLSCATRCQLVTWRDLAEGALTLGDAALAAELRARADRFYRALLRRDIAVPLAVLEAL